MCYCTRMATLERPSPEGCGPTQTARFTHYVPSRPLADCVALFWYWRGHSAVRSTERLLPMPTMELVVRLDGAAPGGGISGPHSEAFFITRSSTDELLGIHFKPGGAWPFLGVPLSDLRNRHAHLADIWGEARAARLVARLREAPGASAKFALLERWLYRVARRPLERSAAASFALDAFRCDSSLNSSAAVAAALKMSQRRFISTFRDEIGLTPKLYSRIGRFQQALARVGPATDVDWVEIATSCGYFDQSHFIHDFREFAGLKPSEYLDLRIDGQLNHVRAPD